MRLPNLGSPVIGAMLYSSSLKFKGNPELTSSMQTLTEMTNYLKANLKVFAHCTIYFAITVYICYLFNVDEHRPTADIKELSHYEFETNDMRRLANTV